MKARHLLLSLSFVATLLLAACISDASVGPLLTESQSVELEGTAPARVEVDLGAGDLEVTGGTEKLLEADFTYNVARLKPDVKFADGALVVRQPETTGLPNLQNIADFRNEWKLRLHEGTPMVLKVNAGAGTSALDLAGLALTQVDIALGAGSSTLDLSGDWVRDLDVAVETGAANVTIRLPKGAGARVVVETGMSAVTAAGLTQDGNVYTNSAYGVSPVTLNVDIEAGVGWIDLAVEE
jgi:hypothetical protein